MIAIIIATLIVLWSFVGLNYFMDDYLFKFSRAKNKWKVFLVSFLFGPLAICFLLLIWGLSIASSIERAVTDSDAKRKLDKWIES